jgi:predicted RNA binding protein YcfA (HicA-like mRNA interferase family)
LPKAYPPLTPAEVISILCAWKFKRDGCKGSHAQYVGFTKGKYRKVTVDESLRDFDTFLMQSMIRQSGLSRKEFYGATSVTAKKIGLK